MKNNPSKWKIALRYAASFGVITALLGCGSLPRVPFTPKMQINKKDEAETVEITKATSTATRDKLTTSNGPAPPLGRDSAEPILSTTPPHLTGEPISVNFEGIRLPAFVNTIFGEVLKVSFEIDNSVMQKDQMVTLRTADPLKPDDFFRLVTEVLSNYGLTVAYSNNVYRVVEAASVKKPIPRIIRSRTAPSTPADMRPIFFFQPLNAVAVNVMQIWMDLIMKDRVLFAPIPGSSGLLLLGNSEDVRSASEIIQTLDQPYLAGRKSLKISPAFWSAAKLSQQLIEIMSAEGYSIGVGGTNNTAIKLIPVDALNVVIAFGSNEETLQHLLQWAGELDQPSQIVSSQGAYYQQIYNAKAKDVADTLKNMIDGVVATPAASVGAGAPPADQRTLLGAAKQRVLVDEPRNGIIFVGSAEEFAQFKALIQQMDRAPLQVMIEATIAEVTLKQGESLGMVFDFDDRRASAPNNLTAKSDGTGIFFNLVRDHATIISRVNALADYNRLQVLSSPRLVTSSGKSAAINVGTQVPIITSQETANGQVQGNTSILQSIQYRNTGVLLNVNPTVNSSRRVELTVSQEVSAAQENSLSGVQSPVIINRSLQTTLSLDDGETVLLGGMISENYSKGNTGIPYLKDIPFLGNLFKNQSQSINRTELIILLTPYIIDNSDTARQIRDNFRNQLGEWAQPASTSTKDADATKDKKGKAEQ